MYFIQQDNMKAYMEVKL